MDGAGEAKGWYSRGYLPHFDVPGLTQSLNFRLHGSMPAEVIEKFKQELCNLQEEQRERELRRKIDQFLDLGLGPRFLAQPDHAVTVQQILLNADGPYYRLHAWCVMPNHVHVLFTPTGKVTLSEIIKGWKGTTNRIIRRAEPQLQRVWAEEYYDRFIRNEAHFWNEVAYIENNPVKAGLCNSPELWLGSSAAYRLEEGGE